MKISIPRPGSRDKFYLKVFRLIGIPLFEIAFAILCGFWWLVDDGDFTGATIALVCFTAFTFNNLHNEGMAYFKDKWVLYLYLPTWVVNLFGYTYGYIVHT